MAGKSPRTANQNRSSIARRSPLTRSQMMSLIRSTGTRPEVAVRMAVHAMGLRFRLHRRDLPGKPDLVFPKRRLVVFVHGCFWHQHRGCSLASRPKTNADYWGPKLARNIERDESALGALKDLGWSAHVIWECETRAGPVLQAKLEAIFSSE